MSADQRDIDAVMFRTLQRKCEDELRLLSRRDEIVRSAYKIGFSKMELHELTGLARTTIDRILGHAG